MTDVELIIAAILRQHRDYREDGLCATCACGAGLFTFEAHEAHVAAAIFSALTVGPLDEYRGL